MCGVVEVWASKYGRGRAVSVSFRLTSFFVLCLDTGLERDLSGNLKLSTWQEFIGWRKTATAGLNVISFSIIIGRGKAPKFYDGANPTSRSERPIGHSNLARSIELGLKQ